MSKRVLLTDSKLKVSELNALALYDMHYQLYIHMIDRNTLHKHDTSTYDVIIGFGNEHDKISENYKGNSRRVQQDILVVEELYNKRLISASIRMKIKEYFQKLKDLDSDTKLRYKIGTFTHYLKSIDGVNENHLDNIKLLINTCKYGIKGIIREHEILNQSVDAWNSCDFSHEGIAINNSDVEIKNWKSLAKMDEVKYFVTPDKKTSNWAVISHNSNKDPLPESNEYFWIHASKFMAKFNNFEKAMKYLEDFIIR